MSTRHRGAYDSNTRGGGDHDSAGYDMATPPTQWEEMRSVPRVIYPSRCSLCRFFDRQAGSMRDDTPADHSSRNCPYGHSWSELQRPMSYKPLRDTPENGARVALVGSWLSTERTMRMPYSSLYPSKATSSLLSARARSCPSRICFDFLFNDEKCSYWENCFFVHPVKADYLRAARSLLCTMGSAGEPCHFTECPFAHSLRQIIPPTDFMQRRQQQQQHQPVRDVVIHNAGASFSVPETHVAPTAGLQTALSGPSVVVDLCTDEACDRWHDCPKIHLLPEFWRDSPRVANLLPRHYYFDEALLEPSQQPSQQPPPQPQHPSQPPQIETTPDRQGIISVTPPDTQAAQESGDAKKRRKAKRAAKSGADSAALRSPQDDSKQEEPQKPAPQPPQKQVTAEELLKALATTPLKPPMEKRADSTSPVLSGSVSGSGSLASPTPKLQQEYPTFPDAAEPIFDLGASMKFGALEPPPLGEAPVQKSFAGAALFAGLAGSRWKSWAESLVANGSFNQIGRIYYHRKSILRAQKPSTSLGVTEDGKFVAVKVTRTDFEGDEDGASGMDELEKRAVVRGIVRPVSVTCKIVTSSEGEKELRKALATELMEGSLPELVEAWRHRGFIGTPAHFCAVQYIAASLLLILRDLDKVEPGVQTRFIKPSHILFDRVHGVHLICDDYPRVGGKQALDGIQFMAPESMSCPMERLTDLWSVGLIIYYMLTGNDKWSPLDVHKVVFESAPLERNNVLLEKRPHILASCHHLLCNLLDRDPAARGFSSVSGSYLQGLLCHPFFWDSHRTCSFVSTVAGIQLSADARAEIDTFASSNVQSGDLASFIESCGLKGAEATDPESTLSVLPLVKKYPAVLSTAPALPLPWFLHRAPKLAPALWSECLLRPALLADHSVRFHVAQPCYPSLYPATSDPLWV